MIVNTDIFSWSKEKWQIFVCVCVCVSVYQFCLFCVISDVASWRNWFWTPMFWLHYLMPFTSLQSLRLVFGSVILWITYTYKVLSNILLEISVLRPHSIYLLSDIWYLPASGIHFSYIWFTLKIIMCMYDLLYKSFSHMSTKRRVVQTAGFIGILCVITFPRHHKPIHEAVCVQCILLSDTVLAVMESLLHFDI